MKITYILLPALLAIVAMPSCKNAHGGNNKEARAENKLRPADPEVGGDVAFAMSAASDGLMEVELGKLAQTNGASATVKGYGQDMVIDHSRVNGELTKMAQTKNITLPAMPNETCRQQIELLKQKTGVEFDNAYMALMVKDHKDDMDMFQTEADKGKDADVKIWAMGKVAILQHHLQVAETIQAGLGK